MKNPIIAVCGLMCSKKTTIASTLKDLFKRGQRINPALLKFADPLYKTLEIFGQSKNRPFLQSLGELARNSFGRDVLETIFEDAVADSLARKRPVICDDLRYESEFNLVKAMGAITIWVEASEETRKASGEAKGVWSGTDHPTEAGLPRSCSFDYMIWHNGDTDDIKRQVKAIYTQMSDPNLNTLYRPSLPLSQYDAVEVNPVIDADGICEATDDPNLASIWSVYLHLTTGGVECIGDFPGDRPNLAHDYAETISRSMGWPVYGYTKEVVNG